MEDSRWDIKVTSKGQITIPKEVRDLMMIREGDYLQAVVRDDAVVLTRKAELGDSEKMRLAAEQVLRKLGYGVSDGGKALPDRILLREKVGSGHPDLTRLVRLGRDKQ